MRARTPQQQNQALALIATPREGAFPACVVGCGAGGADGAHTRACGVEWAACAAAEPPHRPAGLGAGEGGRDVARAAGEV